MFSLLKFLFLIFIVYMLYNLFRVVILLGRSRGNKKNSSDKRRAGLKDSENSFNDEAQKGKPPVIELDKDQYKVE